MRGVAVHTVQRGGEWVNEIEGQGREGRGFWTKQEALQAGRALARRLRVPHLVYNQYGTLEEHSSDWSHRLDEAA